MDWWVLKFFQKSLIDFSQVRPALQVCKSALEQLTAARDPNESQYLDHYLEDADIEHDEDHEEAFNYQIGKPYLQALLHHLEKRFPEANILTALGIFDLQHLPAECAGATVVAHSYSAAWHSSR